MSLLRSQCVVDSPARPKPKQVAASLAAAAEVLVPDSDHSSIETLGSQEPDSSADKIEGPTQNVERRRSSRRSRKRSFVDVVGMTGLPLKR